MNRMNVGTGVLKHLSSASVVSCGLDSSTAGEKDTSACGLQLVTETPVVTHKQWKQLHYVRIEMCQPVPPQITQGNPTNTAIMQNKWSRFTV